ncbi:MAG: cysteine hydrolase [Oceanospirillaceae bacterium]|nr:cysteine hydrolase [Oceanospirillaceae bacterium]
MHALLIIDQQKGIDFPKLGSRNNHHAQVCMLELLGVWRERAYPVIHVKHSSVEPDSAFWPKQQGYEFKPEFEPLDNEYLVIKTVPCAFTHSYLERLLQYIGTKSIVLVGASTNNSIEATARAAGNLGLNAFVVENACFTFDKRDYFGTLRCAHEVHAMSLANLNGEYARVLHSSELMELINEYAKKGYK